MKHLLFIANKAAGKGEAISLLQKARRDIWGHRTSFFVSHSKEHMADYFRSHPAGQFDAIICIGGDGTVNSLLSHVMHTSAVIIPVASGTANDLTRALDLDLDWETILTKLNKKLIRTVDVITVNEKPFITVGGLGIGSELLKEYNNTREGSSVYRFCSTRFKSEIYKFLAAKSILLGKELVRGTLLQTAAPDMEDNVKWVSESSLKLNSRALFVANQALLAGSMKVVPNASNGDGYFEWSVLPDLGRKYYLKTLSQLYDQIIEPPIFYGKTNRLEIRTRDVHSFFGDGEILCEGRNFDIKIADDRVNFLSSHGEGK